MAIDPFHAYNTRSREHVRKIQKLAAEAREPTELPKEVDKGDVAPARRAAAKAGVGDNLAEALIDVHTRSSARASSWVDALRDDVINGDGDIQPELAIVPIRMNGVSSGDQAHSPLDLDSSTSELIGGSVNTGLAAHRLMFTGSV